MKSRKKKANHLGDNIKKFRTSVDLTQKDLAKLANVTQANVSQWEKGKSTPPIKVIQLIKDLYPKVNTEWFFNEPKETKDFFKDETKAQLQRQIEESGDLKKEVQRLKELNTKQEIEINRLREQNEVLTLVARKKLKI